MALFLQWPPHITSKFQLRLILRLVNPLHGRHSWCRRGIVRLVQRIIGLRYIVIPVDRCKVVYRTVMVGLLLLPVTIGYTLVCHGVSILHFPVQSSAVEGFQPLQLI